VIVESRDFVAVPSVGALVPGWLLAIPKRHALNLAVLPRDEAASFAAQLGALKARCTELFGPITTFEHGPAQRNSAVGCSIDHAHMHLVPTASVDLPQAARRHLPHLDWAPCVGLEAAIDASCAGTPYLYIEPPIGLSWLAKGEDIPSQALRRVLAAELGRSQEYDWKAFPQLQHVQETLDRLRSTRA
jgi:diadenosine tetraphosphate (Ap4A) HIT family hydrolase